MHSTAGTLSLPPTSLTSLPVPRPRPSPVSGTSLDSSHLQPSQHSYRSAQQPYAVCHQAGLKAQGSISGLCGLRTPPGDDQDGAMGSTTYHPAHMSAYDDRRHGPSHTAGFSSQLLSNADRTRARLSEAQASLALSSSGSNARSVNALSEPPRVQNFYPVQNTTDHASRLPSFAKSPLGSSPTSNGSAHTHTFSDGRSPEWPTTPSGRSSSTMVHSTAHRKAVAITNQDYLEMTKHKTTIPQCISPEGGSLSDFTAEMTCLFWFESPIVYQQADEIDQMPDGWMPRISQNAIPSASFKTWVSRMLATTQVTQNVVLLALLFIYRLKTWNNIVRGKPGSEFRLLTVALMLGNKFLDDNTYTNKTWSDVSLLNVREIHVMEVEFLSNMRYGLLVSRSAWETWLTKLAKFRTFYSRASTTPLPAVGVSPPRALLSSSVPSPIQHASGGSNLVSPPVSAGGALNIPTYTTGAHAAPVGLATVPQLPPWPSQLPTQIDVPLDTKASSTKRTLSYEDTTEPPSKRTSRFIAPPSTLPPPSVFSQTGAALPMAAPTTATANLFSVATADARRLPVPQLTLNTAAAQGQMPAPNPHSYHPPMGAGPAQVTPVSKVQSSMSLPPPLNHGVRAMATVYSANSNTGVAHPPTASIPAPTTAQVSTTGYAPQHAIAATSGPSLGGPAVTSLNNGATTPTSYAAPAFGTPTKRMSPMNALTPSAASVYAAAATSSPLGESFPHLANGVHTPVSHSPSIYLQQRPSPYRPIRHVQMLLNPSSNLQDYQASGPILIPPTQMYYQPLGRPDDVRSGIVPDFQHMQYGGGALRHGASLTPIHALQQHQVMQPMPQALQMPVRDVRAQQVQQQQLQQQQLQQQHLQQQQIQQQQLQQQQVQQQVQQQQLQAAGQPYFDQQTQFQKQIKIEPEAQRWQRG